MSRNDSSRRRQARGDRVDSGTKTPITFYLMMGAMALAVLYLVSLLFI